MSWAWRYWLVHCRNCGWFTAFYPPDQTRDNELEKELKNTKCPDCKAGCRVTWHG